MDPAIDPRDPATIPRWEKSEHNFYRSKIELVDLFCFRGKMTKRGHSKAKPMPIEMCYALESGVAAEQWIALKRFQEEERELYAKARAAVYDQYQETYSACKEALTSAASILECFPTEIPVPSRRSAETESEFHARMRADIEDQVLKAQRGEIQSWASLASMMFSGDDAETPALLPKIEEGDELDNLVSFGSISVFRPRKGISRIGIVMECSWDEEHGMGIVIAGDEIERVGDSGVVHLAASKPARRKRRKG